MKELTPAMKNLLRNVAIGGGVLLGGFVGYMLGGNKKEDGAAAEGQTDSCSCEEDEFEDDEE